MTKQEENYNYIKGRIRNRIAEAIGWTGAIIIFFAVIVALALLMLAPYTYGTTTGTEFQYEPYWDYESNSTVYVAHLVDVEVPAQVNLLCYLWGNLMDFFFSLPTLERWTVYLFLIGVSIILIGVFIWDEGFSQRKKRKEKQQRLLKRQEYCEHEHINLELEKISGVDPKDDQYTGYGIYVCLGCKKEITKVKVSITAHFDPNIKW